VRRSRPGANHRPDETLRVLDAQRTAHAQATTPQGTPPARAPPASSTSSKVDPNKVSALPPGAAYVIGRGRAIKVQILQAPDIRGPVPDAIPSPNVRHATQASAKHELSGGELPELPSAAVRSQSAPSLSHQVGRSARQFPAPGPNAAARIGQAILQRVLPVSSEDPVYARSLRHIKAPYRCQCLQEVGIRVYRRLD
jgi:hypothetical protein